MFIEEQDYLWVKRKTKVGWKPRKALLFKDMHQYMYLQLELVLFLFLFCLISSVGKMNLQNMEEGWGKEAGRAPKTTILFS